MEWHAESDLFTGVGLNDKGAAETAAPSNDETLEGITLLHEPSGHHGSTSSPPQYSANLNHMLLRLTSSTLSQTLSSTSVGDPGPVMPTLLNRICRAP